MREHHRRVRDWLREQGARHIMIKQKGGRHPKLTFTHAGESYRVPIAQSSSDWRATRNAIAELRRVIGYREIEA